MEQIYMQINLPNALTITRIVLIPFCVIALFHNGGDDSTWRTIAWVGFFLVGMTDLLDGKLARARNEITELGKFLDPVADKLLIGSAMISVSILGYLPWWITGVILGRELAVTVLRLIVVKRNAGKVIPASRGGKIKTTMQGFSTGFYVLPLSTTFHTARDLFMYATIAVTLYTGAQYFQAALKKD